MLNPKDAAVLFIDVQGKLAQAMHEPTALLQNLSRVLRGAQILDVPVFWTEQIPEKIGPTAPELAALIPDGKPLPKTTFSCWGDAAIQQAIRTSGRRQFLLCGIETHVCVYQTAAEMLRQGYEVFVIVDAVSSRAPHNRYFALRRLERLGAGLLTTEMALLEMLRDSADPRFKAILQLIK